MDILICKINVNCYDDYPREAVNRLIADLQNTRDQWANRSLARIEEFLTQPNTVAWDMEFLPDSGARIEGEKVSAYFIIIVSYSRRSKPQFVCHLGPEERMQELSERVYTIHQDHAIKTKADLCRSNGKVTIVLPTLESDKLCLHINNLY